jgi:hypothetical protein
MWLIKSQIAQFANKVGTSTWRVKRTASIARRERAATPEVHKTTKHGMAPLGLATTMWLIKSRIAQFANKGGFKLQLGKSIVLIVQKGNVEP